MHPKEKIVENILKQFRPDRDALLKLISSRITDVGLMDIAVADVPFDAEQNLTALKSVKLNNIIPTYKELNYDTLGMYLYYELRENRSFNPMYDEFNKELKNLKLNDLYLGRAYCCIILLIAGISDGEYYSIQNQRRRYNLFMLIESITYLGKEFQLALISFLSYLFYNKESFDNFFILSEEDCANQGKNIIPSFIFALIYLLLKAASPIKEDKLKVLVEWLIEESKKAEDNYYYNGPWRKNHTIEFLGVYDLKYDKEMYIKWINLAKEIPSLITHLKDQDLINQLTEISVLISKNEHLYKND